MMKFFLVLILFGCFVLTSICVYLYYLYRYKLFSDLVYISKYLKNNISFNKDDINTILSKSFENINQSSKFIIKNYKRFLSKSDKKIVSDFFQSLGRGDVAFEINNLTYFENNFMDLENKTKENLSKNGVMYFKLIIGVGLIVCVLLI